MDVHYSRKGVTHTVFSVREYVLIEFHSYGVTGGKKPFSYVKSLWSEPHGSVCYYRSQ